MLIYYHRCPVKSENQSLASYPFQPTPKCAKLQPISSKSTPKSCLKITHKRALIYRGCISPPLIAQEGVSTSSRGRHPRLRPLFHCSPYQHLTHDQQKPAPKKSTPPLSTAPTAQAQRNPGRRPGQHTNPAIPQDCLSGPRLSSTRTPTPTPHHHNLELLTFHVSHLTVPRAAGHTWMKDRNQDQLRR